MNDSHQTFTSFHDKWANNKELAFAETLRAGSDIQDWIINRNGFATIDAFQDWLSSPSRILDAGCGNGRVTALLRQFAKPSAQIVGFDLTSAQVAKENLSGAENVSFFQKNLLDDLSDLGTFDLIYCQEVLHHTTDPFGSFMNLCKLLDDNGEIAIYVYKKKAPVREYADDYVREMVSSLPYDEAMAVTDQITELGKALSALDTDVEVPDVEILGIEGGNYDVQRFIYHFFLKCFWNPDLTFEANSAINYDWYHPQLCSRHTLAEIEGWYQQAGLEIIHRNVDHYGITIRGKK